MFKNSLNFSIRQIAVGIMGFVIFFLPLVSPLYGMNENSGEGTFDYSWKQIQQKCVDGNCENGKGTMIYYSSQKYVGEFKNGKRNGQGTLYLPLGTVMKGTWRNNEIVKGTARFSDGTRYTGTWQFGYRQGKGELIYPDGRKYIGEFHSGIKDGQGKMIYPDGRVYSGEFEAGERTGYGTMVYPDGSKKTGRFSDGEYVGPEQ